jgi:hypothetical protein
MLVNKEANTSDQTVRPICITLRDGVALDYKGWVEENPNGSITIHDVQGRRTVYLRDEYQDWHFDETQPTT